MTYENQIMDSMFTTISPEEHKALKRPVAQKFSMTSIRTLKYLIDPCTDIFARAMLDLQGQEVDLGTWLQWYAFDVIGAITFSRRFGFMEEKQDINHIVSGIEAALKYGGIVGMIPSLHPYLFGNMMFRKVLFKLGSRDPLPIVTDVSTAATDRRGLVSIL